MLWKCIACKWKEPKDCGTLHIYRQNTRHKELLMGRLKRRQQKISIESTTDTLLQKKCRKKRRKMNEDWLSIQTKNVRFYSSIFCYTFFSYLPSYYLSKTFIQSGTVATPYLYNMIYKKNINTGFTVDYSLEQTTYLHVLYLLFRNKIKQNWAKLNEIKQIQTVMVSKFLRLKYL